MFSLAVRLWTRNLGCDSGLGSDARPLDDFLEEELAMFAVGSLPFVVAVQVQNDHGSEIILALEAVGQAASVPAAEVVGDADVAGLLNHGWVGCVWAAR